MTKRLRNFSKTLLAAAALSALTGAASARDIVWARYGDIDTLDPHRATSTLSLQVWSLIYDTLLATDKDGNPVPNMAQSWTANEAGTEYSFKLRDGIVCHDGTPLDANDVKYTVDRALNADNPSVTSSSWGPITAVEVVDPLTVKFTLSSPFVALVPFLADSFSSIMCDSNADAADFGTGTAIGSGPWVFESWTKGDKITLKKNPDYTNFGKLAENKGAPYMDGLQITVVPEPQARLAALKTGQVDIAEPPFDDVEDIKASGELDIVVAENTGQNVFWEFAAHRPPFNDKRARLAVGHATDAAAAIGLIYGDLSLPEKCPVSRGVFGNDQEVCGHSYPSYDPEKAKALLSELGYGPDKPLETNMLVWTGGQSSEARRSHSGPTRRGRHCCGDPDDGYRHHECACPSGKRNADWQRLHGYDDVVLVRSDILYALWHSPGAYRGYTSPELDAMLEETRVLTDPQARKAKVQEVFKYLLENGIHIPLYTPGWEWVFAVRPEVTGFHTAPFVYPTSMM